MDTHTGHMGGSTYTVFHSHIFLTDILILSWVTYCTAEVKSSSTNNIDIIKLTIYFFNEKSKNKKIKGKNIYINHQILLLNLIFHFNSLTKKHYKLISLFHPI